MTALLLSVDLGQAAIYRVKTNGNDANNGSSWNLAMQTVGNALAATQAGDQVWVAAGTYFECVVVKDGVGLYGGLGGSENTLAEGNWMVNLSVLNANEPSPCMIDSNLTKQRKL